jgi:hypothetical protein
MTDKPLTIAAFGARGTGKTVFVRQYLDTLRPPRLAVWDFKHDPALKTLGKPYADLRAFVLALKLPGFHARYLPDHTKDMQKQFDVFCAACWTASRLVMFVDELPEVTKASRAPATWRRCVNVGREYTAPDGKPGWLAIIGAGQRAAECDKSFTSNADVVHCGRLAHEDDAKAMCKVLGCASRELMTMPDLHWIERRAGQIKPAKGVLTFKGNKKVKINSSAPPPDKKPLSKSP